MKLNSRSALDPRWTTHHVPVVAGFMLATIRIIRKKPSTTGVRPVYDQQTRTWSTDAFETVLTSTPARVQPYGIGNNTVVGQDTTGRRLIRVQIEAKGLGVNVDDIIIVETCPDNSSLENYVFEVRDKLGSSNAWVTDIVAQADSKERNV